LVLSFCFWRIFELPMDRWCCHFVFGEFLSSQWIVGVVILFLANFCIVTTKEFGQIPFLF